MHQITRDLKHLRRPCVHINAYMCSVGFMYIQQGIHPFHMGQISLQNSRFLLIRPYVWLSDPKNNTKFGRMESTFGPLGLANYNGNWCSVLLMWGKNT